MGQGSSNSNNNNKQTTNELPHISPHFSTNARFPSTPKCISSTQNQAPTSSKQSRAQTPCQHNTQLASSVPCPSCLHTGSQLQTRPQLQDQERLRKSDVTGFFIISGFCFRIWRTEASQAPKREQAKKAREAQPAMPKPKRKNHKSVTVMVSDTRRKPQPQKGKSKPPAGVTCTRIAVCRAEQQSNTPQQKTTVSTHAQSWTGRVCRPAERKEL